METTKKTKKKSITGPSRELLMDAYKKHVLTEGSKPVSVYKFCLDSGIQEDAFYTLFGSFDGVEKSIWKTFIDRTIGRLQADETFLQFSAMEKVLAFYYTLLEELRTDRSFIVYQLKSYRGIELAPTFIKSFKNEFDAFFTTVVHAGQQSGEIATRPLLTKRYPDLFWLHFGMLLKYWKEDESPAFEKTDAYVEKSVTLAFELIGKGVIDSAIDFGKFMYQSRKEN